MRFSSLPFLFGFLPITLAIFFAVPLRWRNLALLLTSLVFYGWGEPIYISFMVLSIHMNEYRVRSESGPQVFYRAGSGAGRLLAVTLQEARFTALSPQ